MLPTAIRAGALVVRLLGPYLVPLLPMLVALPANAASPRDAIHNAALHDVAVATPAPITEATAEPEPEAEAEVLPGWQVATGAAAGTLVGAGVGTALGGLALVATVSWVRAFPSPSFSQGEALGQLAALALGSAVMGVPVLAMTGALLGMLATVPWRAPSDVAVLEAGAAMISALVGITLCACPTWMVLGGAVAFLFPLSVAAVGGAALGTAALASITGAAGAGVAVLGTRWASHNLSALTAPPPRRVRPAAGAMAY